MTDEIDAKFELGYQAGQKIENLDDFVKICEDLEEDVFDPENFGKWIGVVEAQEIDITPVTMEVERMQKSLVDGQMDFLREIVETDHSAYYQTLAELGRMARAAPSNRRERRRQSRKK